MLVTLCRDADAICTVRLSTPSVSGRAVDEDVQTHLSPSRPSHNVSTSFRSLSDSGPLAFSADGCGPEIDVWSTKRVFVDAGRLLIGYQLLQGPCMEAFRT